MFLINNNEKDLFMNFEKIGLRKDIENSNVLIKINLSGIYGKNHPRTDISLLKKLVSFIYQNGGTCSIAEGANGRLVENLVFSGFDDFLDYYNIKVIDIEQVECDEVLIHRECHYIPKCFQEYSVRIGLPAASKREEMLYSNNIKLFFGAVPKNKYQLDYNKVSNGVPRPKLHINLNSSIVNLFLAINNYSPFKYYINGGLSYNEKIGEFTLAETYIGDNALELDNYLFQTYFNNCEYPEYLNILKIIINN